MYNRPFVLEGTTMYDTPITVANKYGIVGGFLTYAYGWLTDTNNAVFVGVLATLAGLIVSVVCQILKHKREARAALLSEELARNEEARRKELHAITLSTLKTKPETSS
jgi:hypothetical protein